MTEPLPDDRLAEIRAAVAHLLEKAAQPNRFPRDNESHWESEGWKNGTANALIKLNPTALLDETARLRAEVAELKATAERHAQVIQVIEHACDKGYDPDRFELAEAAGIPTEQVAS